MNKIESADRAIARVYTVARSTVDAEYLTETERLDRIRQAVREYEAAAPGFCRPACRDSRSDSGGAPALVRARDRLLVWLHPRNDQERELVEWLAETLASPGALDTLVDLIERSAAVARADGYARGWREAGEQSDRLGPVGRAHHVGYADGRDSVTREGGSS